MKLMFKSYLNGWWMTGLYGRRKGVYWFLGFSREATTSEQLDALKQIEPDMELWLDGSIHKKYGKWYKVNNDA